jgi:hypothetical protein
MTSIKRKPKKSLGVRRNLSKKKSLSLRRNLSKKNGTLRRTKRKKDKGMKKRGGVGTLPIGNGVTRKYNDINSHVFYNTASKSKRQKPAAAAEEAGTLPIGNGVTRKYNDMISPEVYNTASNSKRQKPAAVTRRREKKKEKKKKEKARRKKAADATPNSTDENFKGRNLTNLGLPVITNNNRHIFWKAKSVTEAAHETVDQAAQRAEADVMLEKFLRKNHTSVKEGNELLLTTILANQNITLNNHEERLALETHLKAAMMRRLRRDRKEQWKRYLIGLLKKVGPEQNGITATCEIISIEYDETNPHDDMIKLNVKYDDPNCNTKTVSFSKGHDLADPIETALSKIAFYNES